MPPYVALPDQEHTVYYAYSITGSALAGEGTVELGSFEKFSERSTRTIERIRNIAYETGPKVIDMAWGGTDITIELTHVELYLAGLIAVFGFSAVPALEYWNKLIEINEFLHNPKTATTRVITFSGCVPSDYSKDVDIGTARVLEHMTFQASYVEVSVATLAAPV